MRWLKDFKAYKESIVIDMGIAKIGDLLESLTIWHDTLLRSVGAEELDLFDTLDIDKNDFDKKMLDLDYLCGVPDQKDPDERFVNALTGKKWKKSEVQNTEDYETFLNKACKFMFIYKEESNELENPLYLMLQTWNESLGEWSEVKLYKFNGEAKRFYDVLSSKKIQIEDGGERYVYSTSNGNDWSMMDTTKENETWPKSIRNEELEKLVDERRVSITII